MTSISSFVSNLRHAAAVGAAVACVALTGGTGAHASTLALDFTGTALPNFLNSNYARENVPDGLVTGTILFEDGLNTSTMTLNTPGGVRNSLDATTVGGTGSISATVTYGTITDTQTAPGPNPGTNGSISIIEGAQGIAESFRVEMSVFGVGRFNFRLQGSDVSDFISADPTQGLSVALFESINLGNTTLADGLFTSVTNGQLVFEVDTVSARLVGSSTGGTTPVPLPAGLPLLLLGIGGFCALRARKSRLS